MFYAYLAVHAVAIDYKPVHSLLNQAPLFWNTSLGALQTASFMALGRIFDDDSAHNVAKLLRVAQDHREIFCREALARRRQGDDPQPATWLGEFVRDAYEPTPQDFRRIRFHVQRQRKIYESNYRDIRHKLFAHKAISGQTEIARLFGKTNIRELQQLFVFLRSLYDALWDLFFNGRKPVLRPLRYSVKQIRRLPLNRRGSRSVHERITHEVEQFLRSVSPIPEKRLKRGRL